LFSFFRSLPFPFMGYQNSIDVFFSASSLCQTLYFSYGLFCLDSPGGDHSPIFFLPPPLVCSPPTAVFLFPLIPPSSRPCSSHLPHNNSRFRCPSPSGAFYAWVTPFPQDNSPFGRMKVFTLHSFLQLLRSGAGSVFFFTPRNFLPLISFIPWVSSLLRFLRRQARFNSQWR